MPLINCPECRRQVSTAAVACPQCGHPVRTASAPNGPTCYTCSAAATTKCQSCGALSCARHVQSIYVSYFGNRGGGYELRCDGCYSTAQGFKLLWIIIGVLFVGFYVVLFATHRGR